MTNIIKIVIECDDPEMAVIMQQEIVALTQSLHIDCEYFEPPVEPARHSQMLSDLRCRDVRVRVITRELDDDG